MKVLMIHIGNPVGKDPALPDSHYYERLSFETGGLKNYLKKDIVNADSQMQSLRELGLNISYGYLGDRRKLSSLMKAGKIIRRRVKEERIDIVHVLWGASSSMVTVMYSPVPVIISFCGSDLAGNYDDRGRMTMSGRLSVTLSKISSYFARRIIVKSEFLKQKLSSAVQEKCHVIPNGVDLSKFYVIGRNEARRHLGWKENEKVIIFFTGSGAHVKNAPLADKVYSLVSERMPGTRMIKIENIVFEDLVWYYNAADVMLLTSLHEGSNNSVKEAMSCNLPVVSVNCGDTKYRLRNVRNSYVVDSYDEALLAGKVLNVLETGERSNGRDWIHEVSMETVAGQVKEVYKEVLLEKNL